MYHNANSLKIKIMADDLKITKSQLLRLLKYRYFGPPLLVLASLHFLGMLSFYYTTTWYDSALHLAGGFWIGLIYLEWARIRNEKFILSEAEVFKVILFALMIGLAWEVFEVVYDLTFAENSGFLPLNGGLFDTAKDLILDMVGALIATFTIRHNRKEA